MTQQLEIATEGALGVIALNRPEAINALSLGMIEGITEALTRWETDDVIGAVLFEGRGTKGFCAGGDVRAVRALVLEGRHDEAVAYFAAEYRMNRLIATFAKPVVVMTQGIVMGGGIGIAGHARFRITLPGARFAMPEAAIGFFSDVGVNAILAKAPLNRALLFLMSGASVGAADALALGLADAAVAPERAEAVRVALAGAAEARDPQLAIVGLLQADSIVVGEAEFCLLADLLPTEQPKTAEAFVEDVSEVRELAGMGRLIASRSPTALTAIFHAHLAARRAASLGDVLDMDLRLARVMCGLPDFAEGVRAVLVDKNQQPNWSPMTLAEVDSHAIRTAVEMP